MYNVNKRQCLSCYLLLLGLHSHKPTVLRRYYWKNVQFLFLCIFRNIHEHIIIKWIRKFLMTNEISILVLYIAFKALLVNIMIKISIHKNISHDVGDVISLLIVISWKYHGGITIQDKTYNNSPGLALFYSFTAQNANKCHNATLKKNMWSLTMRKTSFCDIIL